LSDNLVLEHLRAIRGDLATLTDRIDDLSRRVTALETETRQGLASVQLNLANQSMRLDGFEARMARIERRLNIADAPA
jgi:hypothetical protein